MKTLIITLFIAIPFGLQAQNLSGLVKAVEKAAGSSAAKQVLTQNAAAAARVQQAVDASQARAEKAIKEHSAKESAFLRARLLGEFDNSPVILRKNQLLARQQAAEAANIQNFSCKPSARLSKESRRLNLPLATALLQHYKKEIINGYALTQEYLEGYYLRRIYPYLQKPAFVAEKNGYMYRGVFMTIDELIATLKNGFLTSMNTWNVGAKNRGDKFISFSSSTGEALTYIFQGTGTSAHPDGIGVVFEVESGLEGLEFWQNAQLNSTKTIYHCYKDVPASKIRNVYIYGKYGLENVAEIIIKAREGKISSREDWVHNFDNRFLR